MNQKEQATIDLVINGRPAEASIKDVEKSVSALRNSIKKMREDDDPELYAKKLAEFRKLNTAYIEMNGNLKNMTTGWQRFKKEMGTVAVGVLGGNVLTAAFQSFISFVPDTLSKLRDLKNEFANIEKAADMTSVEVAKLNEKFKNLDTVTPTKELRAMAVVGGQFGVAKDQILDFVEGADKLNVALGDQFGSAEEVADTMIKLRNIFQDIKTTNIQQDMLHIGNAINVLESAGAATAPVIADFSSRMGGVIQPLGVASAQTIGLSAALQELNITAERGSTAVTKIFQKMLTNTDQFASVAGMSTKRFKAMIETDIFGAFMAFVEGSKRGGQGAIAFAELLKDSELAGAGVSEVVSKLATNIELVEDKVKLAGGAINSTNSILDEFAKKNFQLAEDMKEFEGIGKSITQSKVLGNLFAGGLRGTLQFYHAIRNLFAFFSNNGAAVTAFVYILVALNANLVKATVSTIANTTAKLYNNLAYAAGYRWLVLTETATKAYAFAKAVLTGKINLATAAQRVWNAVVAANPFGALVTALFAVVAAVQLYVKNNEAAIKLEREKVRLGRDLERVNTSLKDLMEGINGKIKDFNQLSVLERQNLLQTIKLKKQEALARLENLKARQLEIAKESAAPSFAQKLRAGFSGSPGNMVTSLTKSIGDNMAEASTPFDDSIKQIEENIKGFDAAISTVSDRLNAYNKAMKIGGDTTDQLREKQSLLQVALDGAKLGSAEYKKIAAEMAKVNAQLGGGPVKPSGDDKNTKSTAKKQEDEYLKEIAEARLKNFQNGLSMRDKEINAIMEKYNTMRALAKDNGDRLIEIANEEATEHALLMDKWAEEDRLKAVENEKKKFEAINKAQQELNEQAQRDIALRVATGELDPEAAEDVRLEQEQSFLTQQYMLRWGMGMQTADLERQLADNFIKQEQRKRDFALQTNQAILIARQELLQSNLQAAQAGAGFLAAIFKDQKAVVRAMFLAEKAAAIAQVIVRGVQERAAIKVATAAQVAAASASVIGLPAVPGIKALGAMQLAKSRMDTITSVAGIASTAIREFADGGFTKAAYSNDTRGGMVTAPTIFNGKYIAGEAGNEWMASNKTLSNPVAANIIGALDALQSAGKIDLLNNMVQPAAQAVAPQQINMDYSRIENMIGELASIVREVDAKPTVLSLTEFEEQSEKLTKIRGF